MTDVIYTKQGDENSYSVRIGPYNRGKALNVQYFTELEVGYIRNSIVPIDDGPNEWMNAGELIGNTGLNVLNKSEDYLTELLPKNCHGVVTDWEILVLFSHVTLKGMKKTCLKNKKTNEVCLITSWDQKFECKAMAGAKDGWWVCSTNMYAPASFYAAVKRAL
jgi:hypothetical protein